VNYGQRGYCTSCEVYLAVYGYSAGSFTIQASSNGIMKLFTDKPIGDSVNQNKYSYYSYFNRDEFGEISISLTSVSFVMISC
jgi:hypothetical protein